MAGPSSPTRPGPGGAGITWTGAGRASGRSPPRMALERTSAKRANRSLRDSLHDTPFHLAQFVPLRAFCIAFNDILYDCVHNLGVRTMRA
eukprot:scaffold94521_cov18-Prasinocladus_malaysianus.AAC.1